MEAIAASPLFSLSASISVSKRRICMVQGTFNSSQIRRARSTLSPTGFPSAPA
jgi:hypothetical protein